MTVAYFVKIDNDHKVKEVIVIANADCDNLPFPESEPVGQAFIASLNISGNWLQTSFNGNFRRKYAQIGFIYDQEQDAFFGDEIPTE